MAGSDAAQRMKPMTAAKRLGIHLPATPEEFQQGTYTRAQLDELERHPPQWLDELRRHGPHPRPVVAGRLGISISGLNRAGMADPLTTDEINALRDDPPQWLVTERVVHQQVVAEEEELARRKKPGGRA